MSLTSFHAGHESHSLVKAFLQLRCPARRRFVEMTRAAIKREAPEDPQPVQRTSSRSTRQPTAELPERGSSQRAISIISLGSPAPGQPQNSTGMVPNGDVGDDVEMADLNGAGRANGHTNGFCDGPNGTDGARSSPAATLIGDDNIDFDQLGEDSLPLFELSQHLESLGIANTLPSLPKATLVGDQNHGKSSVGEAISGISFPREEGTCTRAPFEVTVSPAETGVEWEATIKLFIKYEYTPKAKAQDRHSYAGWVECYPATIFFRKTENKEEAARILQEAQLAILNPPYQGLLSGNHPRPTSNRVSFTPNVIQVHVKRKAKLSLSFIDLPGLVTRLGPDEQHLVDLVRKLVRNYVQEPNSLILLTHSSDVDIETTQAYNLVVEAKAQNRTIGILTKPDNAKNNGRARMAILHRFLKGEFPLGAKDGWFITKQLSSDDLEAGVTHAQARDMEQKFFSTPPWTTDLAEFSQRFGTANLSRAISVRLRDHILLQLPEMMAKAQARLEEVDAKLQTFPKPSQSPTNTVWDAIQEVAVTISTNIRGIGPDKSFSRRIKQTMVKLRTDLELARPQPILRTPGYEPPSISVDSDESEEEQPTPSKKVKSNAGTPFSTPSSKSKKAAAPFSQTPRRSAKPEEQRGETPAGPERAKFRLDEVRELIDSDGSRSLAVTVDPKVLDQLITFAQQPWSGIVEAIIHTITEILASTLGDSVQATLADRLKSKLYERTLGIVKAFVDSLLAEQNAAIMHILEKELHAHVTHNPFLQTETSRLEAKLEEKRLDERLNEYFDPLAAKGSNKVPSSLEARRKHKDELNLKSPDEYSREVKSMAYPMAYYTLAARRMVDNVAMQLECELIHPIERGILGQLREGLDARDEAKCVELLAEDPVRERERLGLLEERGHLLEAVESLRGLPRVGGMEF
ncbi:P-loop containing nucleoside triphosphate hydrolase protein [Teratosphaeria nubilosa]|uniref:P-loop containing nucleoside triphosphate hydrolase protein n=1 Tax=Teratosphaeria nubilosa TaxID=161662 RepID=A0A6G1KZ33_9PEZI|nr:P-loop containing nucleoside triphosphate hydrolase protein [Teratosphaeria nubilosa]